MRTTSLLLLISSLLIFSSCLKKRKGTCSDGIANQNETMVDCGGPCQACGTCFDGIRNQGEEGVDCGGGVCEPCATCEDGILNQGETEIDCGGPCKNCPITYPRYGQHGQNIIGPDTFKLIAEKWYSMRADLPEGDSLRIYIKNTTEPYNGSKWWYALGSSVGGYATLYGKDAPNTQEFFAAGKVSFDFNMYFTGSGKATIEVHENKSPHPNFVKHISW